MRWTSARRHEREEPAESSTSRGSKTLWEGPPRKISASCLYVGRHASRLKTRLRLRRPQSKPPGTARQGSACRRSRGARSACRYLPWTGRPEASLSERCYWYSDAFRRFRMRSIVFWARGVVLKRRAFGTKLCAKHSLATRKHNSSTLSVLRAASVTFRTTPSSTLRTT